MFSPRMTRQIVRATIIVPLTLQVVALGQVSIRLNGVPDGLCLPLPEGVNQILTATIKGDAVTSVWVATTDAKPLSQRVMLTKVDEGEYAVNLGVKEVYEFLKTYGASGQFRVFAETTDGTIVQSISVRYSVHAVPERLDLPWDEAKISIYQRASRKLPGSNGTLSVHLGDITAGHVLVSVYGPRGDPIVDSTPMREGSTLSLSLPGQDYVLRLDELVSLLLGNDYGVFSVMPSHAWEAKKIDRLLEIISASGLTFIRNGQKSSSEVFATHLRQKYEFYAARRHVSLCEFIINAASHSSTTGKPYRVRLPNGDILDADTWLREQAGEIVRGRKEEDASEAQSSEEPPFQCECRLDRKAIKRFLDTVETSGVSFTCSGIDLTGVHVGWFLRTAGRLDPTTAACFDWPFDESMGIFEAWDPPCQTTLRDGRIVPATSWFQEQAAEAAVETEASNDALADR